jgi:hypothetical protein
MTAKVRSASAPETGKTPVHAGQGLLQEIVCRRPISDIPFQVAPEMGRELSCQLWEGNRRAGLLHHPLPAAVFVVGLPDATQPVRPLAITLTSV